MDSNDVVITITTMSLNGEQSEDELDTFIRRVVGLSKDLSQSSVTVDVVKHRLFK